MNLIILTADELAPDNTVSLTDRRAVHIRKILRGQPGDRVRIGLLNGAMGYGIITAASPGEVLLHVTLEAPPPALPPVDLILALPRPIMLKRILAQAAAMGCERIFLINANRVEKSFFSASLLDEDNYRTCLLEGLEQGVGTAEPEVFICKRFKPFMEDTVPLLIPPQTVKLLAHPEAAVNLPRAVPHLQEKRVALAVGPEGGWIDFEIALFIQAGFTPFTLGPRILRTDTAVPALLAQIDLLRSLPAVGV